MGPINLLPPCPQAQPSPCPMVPTLLAPALSQPMGHSGSERAALCSQHQLQTLTLSR